MKTAVLIALLIGCATSARGADSNPVVVEFGRAAEVCGWGPRSEQFWLLNAADEYGHHDFRTSASEVLGLSTSTVSEQARAAVASCVAGLTGEPDELAPRGGPGNLVRINRWGERLAFDPARGATLWAAHVLTAGDLAARAASGLVRGNRQFSVDPAVPISPRPEDYRSTGKDRGHLQPAGDAADARALDESFLMGNVVPQDHNMNGQPWEFLEAAVRDLVSASDGRAVVVTGALFLTADKQPLAPGTEARLSGGRAGVPTHIFKAFLLHARDQKRPVVAAFLCPNSFAGGKRDEQLKYLRGCTIDVRELARISELRLFGGALDGDAPASPRGHRGPAAELWPARAP